MTQQPQHLFLPSVIAKRVRPALLAAFTGTKASSSTSPSYHWRYAVIDCFHHGCNQLDCAGPAVNAFLTLVVMVLSIVQMGIMVHKRIHCTWKFFLTLFIFIQTLLLVFVHLFMHDVYWSFFMNFLEMTAFLFILFFFAQYNSRVTSYSDKLQPWVFPLFGTLVVCMLVLLIDEVLTASEYLLRLICV